MILDLFSKLIISISYSLFVINDLNGSATQTEIARRLIRKDHTVSALISRMEKRGWVKKKRDTRIKRRVNITITEKGKKALDWSGKRESIQEIMSCLSEEEKMHLSSSLEKLRDQALKQRAIIPKPSFP